MEKGDYQGRLFSFPIPTYNIHKNFEWNNPRHNRMWEMTSKYGIPYFANYINSDMDPNQATSMCCRLRIDRSQLEYRGGGLFGSSPNTGSIGVVTINMPRIGYTTKTEEEFFAKLDKLMDSAKESLLLKVKLIEKLTDQGLYPYTRVYLAGIKKDTGRYWANHFLTIGLLGMNEALINFMHKDITAPEGNAFAEKVLQHMRNKIIAYQIDTKYLFNLEATPGEGTTRRFANSDKKKYPGIIVANENKRKTLNVAPYYTNSSQIPVDANIDLFTTLKLQEPLQTKYTGGTVLHIFLGEKAPSLEAVKTLVRLCCENYSIPYFSVTPTFSICPIHGYQAGEYKYCPQCLTPEDKLIN
jgi:ribonucleoside-triphosphate reductase